MKSNYVSLISFFLTVILISVFGCKKKKTNEALYNASIATDLSFYKGKDTIYDPKGGSPHGYFKLKFNQTAINALGADGKLPIGETFPEGSVIVKEIYASGAISLYAVMKKDRNSKFASHKWVWGEYSPSGKTVVSVNGEGKECVSCHTNGTTRDLTLSFDLH